MCIEEPTDYHGNVTAIWVPTFFRWDGASPPFTTVTDQLLPATPPELEVRLIQRFDEQITSVKKWINIERYIEWNSIVVRIIQSRQFTTEAFGVSDDSAYLRFQRVKSFSSFTTDPLSSGYG